LTLPDSLNFQIKAQETRRLVFFAGLPATGKSLFVHELAVLAHAAGRDIHLLQWDVARPAFEAGDAGSRYPLVAGITDPVVRRATGLWARGRIAAWNTASPPGDILIGETPLVGGRLIELARRIGDNAEAVLAGEDCRFLISVPSNSVKAAIEERRTQSWADGAPAHIAEREEAPPALVHQMWLDLFAAGKAMGLSLPDTGDDYDSEANRIIHQQLLAHRRSEILFVDDTFDTTDISPYEFDFPVHALVPTPKEIALYIEIAEAMTDPPPWWSV
jgi:hypothetical protein